MAPNPVPVTPEEIIDRVLEEMEAELAPSRYSIFVRSVYHVFLQAAEFERMRSLFHHIREEGERALDDRLQALNKKRRSIRDAVFGGSRNRMYRRVGNDGWKIEFYENRDPEDADSPLIIHSLFAEPKAQEERMGQRTERVSRRMADGTWHTTTSSSPRAPGDTLPMQPSLYAVIEFEDDRGKQQFEMAKTFIRIGRKVQDEGLRKTIWVDLALEVNTNVSKEHCEIRWDEKARRFFIKDLSKFGTWVNGERVAAETEVALPGQATLVLANTVTLQFRPKL